MKLIGVNTGRRIISYQDTSLGVGGPLQLSTAGKIVLDKNKGAIVSGAQTFGQQGIFIGNLNGVPMFFMGSPTQGISWDNFIFKVLGSALVGNLVINQGGSFSIGETSYGVGAGVWVDMDASGNPRFSIQDKNGNFINIDMTAGGVLGISSSGIAGALSSKQVDDGGWTQLATWLGIAQTPTKLSGYGITDAQSTLPNAAGPAYVVQRDGGGAPYLSQKYGTETSIGTRSLGSAGFTAAALVQLGGTIAIPKPAIGTVLEAVLTASFISNAATPQLDVEFEYSTNGGSTWNTGDSAIVLTQSTTQGFMTLNLSSAVTGQGIPTGTGDFQIRVRCENVTGANTITVRAKVIYFLYPNDGAYVITGALAATTPTTGANNCIATFPATTCTASLNVMVTPSGGMPPYTYAWSVVSGTGTITAGATSQTCTVSDTETATTGGANFNTTVHCKVTDSVPNNVTSANDIITNTFTLVYSSINATVSVSPGSCSNITCGNNCTATGSATANATGGNGVYTYSWSVASGTGTIVSGSTSQTVTIHDTQATSQPFPYTVSNTTMQCSVNDTRSTGAVTPQGVVKLTFKCPTT